ncbi:hypothetical protein KCV07_g4468, partial [Aureobasidium melanogenum]
MKADVGLTTEFFDNEEYSDQSGYFAAAFFGLFQVASSPVIDLGDEDDPELVTDLVKYLYRHGPIHDHNKGPDCVTMDQLIDVYLLADKYDVQGLRRTMVAAFRDMALADLQTLRQNHAFKSTFIKHNARICGPASFQLADDTLQALVIHVCQEYSLVLFKNEMFLQQYIKGELFDNKHAAAFGMKLGRDLLESHSITHEEADGLSSDWDPSLIKLAARQKKTKNFSNDKKLSDVRITYGTGQTIFAHKIVLATHSREFQIMLAGSPKNAEIDLSHEHSSTAVRIFIEDMYRSGFMDPAIKHDPSLLAELHLLARKHGRNDIAGSYLRRFDSTLYQEPFTGKYLSHIAEFCGPDSFRYTGTGLPEKAFHNILDRIVAMGDEGTTQPLCKVFAQKLKKGILFNTMFMGRFAAEVTSHYLGWGSDDD